MAPLRPLLAALLVLAIGAPAAGAAEYVVTSPADDGPGSLRAALRDAAATDGGDAIAIADGVDAIALASALPPLGGGSVLDGGGARLTPGADPAAAAAAAAALAALTIAGPGATVRDLEIRGFAADVALAGDADEAALLGLALRDNAVGIRDDGHAGTVHVGGPDGDSVHITGGTTGVLLRDAARVRFTHIEGVAGLAIDRGGDGPTPNVPGGTANHPVIDSADTVLGATRIAGRLAAAPGPATIDLSIAGSCLPPARGTLAAHLAAVHVEVGADGTAEFAVSLPALPAGTAVTATATSPTTTSEPAPCLRTSVAPSPALTGPRPAPPPLALAPAPAAAADAARALTSLTLDQRRARPGHPARLTVTLARAAVVELWIARRRDGRLVDGRCGPTRAAPRGAARCRRAVIAGAIVRHLPAGTSALRVPTRLDGRTLPPGRYRLTVRALDPRTAATLDARRARFRIVP